MNIHLTPAIGIVLFVAAACTGCASTSHKAVNDSETALYIPAQKVALLNGKFEQFAQSPERDLAKQIINGYQKILEQTPNYVPALRGLYSFYYFDAQKVEPFWQERDKSLATLEALYRRLPPLVRREHYPPSFADYQRDSVRTSLGRAPMSQTQALAALLAALKDEPRNAMIRTIFAEHIDQMGFGVISQAVLVEAMRSQPNEDIFPHAMANLLYQRALDNPCVQDDAQTLRPALAYYREALSLNPDARVHSDLGVIYGLLGLQPLMVNEAAALVRQGDLKSLWQAGYLYLYGGNIDKAGHAFNAADKLASLKRQPQGRTYIDYLMVTNQWDKAAEYYPDYLRSKTALDSYDLLLASMIATVAYSENDEIAFENVWLPPRQVTLRSPWPETLLDLTWGEVSVDAVASNLQNTRCNVAQLHFYAGFNAMLQGDQPALKQHADLVDEQSLMFSLESVLAKTLLNR
ncbi:MAG TPA: hypothetical protein VIC26_03120 [Marinagarivorans sp.]